MKINTWSALLSLVITFISLLIGVRLFVGNLKVSIVVTTALMLLPVLVIFFAILYLSSEHLINSFKDHNLVRPYLKSELQSVTNSDDIYILPMSYRCLGVLLIVSPIFLCIVEYTLLALVIIIYLGAYYIKTPYKIEIEKDTFKIFMLLGKHEIRIDDVRAVKTGVFHNRVDCENKLYYLSHFLTNVSSLTMKFAEKTGTQSFDHVEWDVIEKKTDSSSFWINRTILIVIFTILSSVFGIIFMISVAKDIH